VIIHPARSSRVWCGSTEGFYSQNRMVKSEVILSDGAFLPKIHLHLSYGSFSKGIKRSMDAFRFGELRSQRGENKNQIIQVKSES